MRRHEAASRYTELSCALTACHHGAKFFFLSIWSAVKKAKNITRTALPHLRCSIINRVFCCYFEFTTAISG